MKRNVFVKIALLSLVASTTFSLVSCTGMKKTEGGLEYKILKKGEGKTAPNLGDLIEGELWIKAGDSVLLTNEGKPDIIMEVAEPEFAGDLQEGIKLLHVGDSAIFNVCADSIRSRGAIPEIVKDKLTYVIKVTKIMTKDEYQKYLQDKEAKAQSEEKSNIEKYLSDNNITDFKTTPSGVYYVELEKGVGAKIEKGKSVKIDYVGSFLNGTVFDASIEEEAKKANIYVPQRTYSPMEIEVGAGQIIPGMDESLSMMSRGTKAMIIIPFNLAYGARDLGSIPPYSTLVFKLEIVGVK